MAAVQFDSLKYARRLRDVGVPEPQADTPAELMAEAFGFYVDNLVTKEHLDLALDKQFVQQDVRIDARFAEQDVRINALSADVAQRFAEQDARIDAGFADVSRRFVEQDARIDALSADVSRRFVEQDARIDARFAQQGRTLAVHTWMLGVIVLTVLVPTLERLSLIGSP